MAPIRTPEGFVRVEKVPGIAAKLLDAADLVKGADRKADVRTVTGAYHVSEAVYEMFKSTFGEDPAGDDAEAAEAQRQVDAEAAAAAAAEAERVAAEEAAAAEQVEEPDESWTHDQLNEYAGKLTPPLELTGSTPAKAEKIKLIAEHVEKNKA